MEYWIVCKIRNGKWYFVSGTYEDGYPKETTNRAEAWKFYDFATAWTFLGYGYCLHKEYV